MRIALRLGVLICSLLLPTVATAQWPETHLPASSPKWWTLTPEMSPQELRKVRLNREEHRKRFKKTTEVNEKRFVTQEEADNIRVFVDGSQTPSLISLIDALDMMTVYFKGKDPIAVETESREKMAQYGLSSAEIDIVIEAIKLKNTEQERISDLTNGDTIAFVNILRTAKENLGRDAYRKALKGKKFGTLARASGQSVEEVKRLASVWDHDFIDELLIEIVVDLHKELSKDGWEGFRAYLLHEIASDMLIVDFVTDTLE